MHPVCRADHVALWFLFIYFFNSLPSPPDYRFLKVRPNISLNSQTPIPSTETATKPVLLNIFWRKEGEEGGNLVSRWASRHKGKTSSQASPPARLPVPVPPSSFRKGLENLEDLATQAAELRSHLKLSTSQSWNGLVLTKVPVYFQLQGSKWEFRSKDCKPTDDPVQSSKYTEQVWIIEKTIICEASTPCQPTWEGFQICYYTSTSIQSVERSATTPTFQTRKMRPGQNIHQVFFDAKTMLSVLYHDTKRSGPFWTYNRGGPLFWKLFIRYQLYGS